MAAEAVEASAATSFPPEISTSFPSSINSLGGWVPWTISNFIFTQANESPPDNSCFIIDFALFKVANSVLVCSEVGIRSNRSKIVHYFTVGEQKLLPLRLQQQWWQLIVAGRSQLYDPNQPTYPILIVGWRHWDKECGFLRKKRRFFKRVLDLSEEQVKKWWRSRIKGRCLNRPFKYL